MPQPESPTLRTPDACTYDLGHEELMQIWLALDSAIRRAVVNDVTGLRQIRDMFTTAGTVSVTVRGLPY